MGDHQGGGFQAWVAADGVHGWHVDGELLMGDGTPLGVDGGIDDVTSSSAPDAMLILSSRDRVRAGGYYNYSTTEVYLLRPSDKTLRRLTHDKLMETCPALSPRGNLAVFARATRYTDQAMVWPWTDWALVTLDLDNGVEEVWPLPMAGTCARSPSRSAGSCAKGGQASNWSLFSYARTMARRSSRPMHRLALDGPMRT